VTFLPLNLNVIVAASVEA